jgi:hypothetical protein
VGVVQAGDLFRAREVNFLLRVRHIVHVPGALQNFAKEEAERADPLVDAVVG